MLDHKLFTVFFASFLLVAFCDITDGSSLNADDDATYEETCFHGEVTEDGCDCPDGWKGDRCQHCQGRFLEDEASGCISDGNYSYLRFINCAWLIKLNPMFMQTNTSLKLTFDEVAISCSGVTLKVYDGDGEFSPLLATYSGLTTPGKPTMGRVAIAASGMAFLKFESSSPVNTEGYKISFEHTSNSYSATPDEKYISQAYLDNWSLYQWENLIAQGRASAGLAVSGDYVYVYGGFVFGSDRFYEEMLRFDTYSMIVDPVRPDFFPRSRFGHTMISWKDTLLVYGGIIQESYTITNELWSFNTTSENWTRVIPDGEEVPPLVGHSVHLVTMSDNRDVMIVIFGYHPQGQFSNFVFEYDIANNTWARVSTSGAIPFGAYGHASALDPAKNHIYVHGGVKYGGKNQADIYVYYVEEKIWYLLNPIQSTERYLHSMVFIENSLLVYPGRSLQMSDYCDDSNFETYDIVTDTWKTITLPSVAMGTGFGHSAAAVDDSMFIYGRYDGIMHSDVLKYSLDTSRGRCNNYTLASDCQDSPFCTWNNETCEELVCSDTAKDCDSFCSKVHSCVNCLSTDRKCCSCSYEKGNEICFYDDGKVFPSNETEFITDPSLCNVNETLDKRCQSYISCFYCNEVDGCAWRASLGCRLGQDRHECWPTCADQKDCKNCTDMSGCSWCQSEGKCIPSADSEVYFPYDTCSDWRYQPDECIDPCISATSCDECRESSQCGWCAIDVETGLGQCESGMDSGTAEGFPTCTGAWFYSACPPCQCNGHSICVTDRVCANCTDDTEGETCENCEMGYYGDPLNGGNCTACECNGHADSCKSNGVCNCNVYGMTGDHCESCIIAEDISGNAINDTCFYEIQPGYRYKFPLISSYYTEMNFNTCPDSRSDLLISFESLSYDGETGDLQRFDLLMTSYYYGDVNETIFREFYNATSEQVLMKQNVFRFGKDPLHCLRFYATFESPYTLQVQFVKTYTSIGILLGAFFAVFIFLLIVAIIFWKVNAMWMNYQMRRRREIELEVMATRPFACVDFDYMEKLENEKDLLFFGEETTFGGGAAVASTLLWLPYGKSIDDKEPNIAFGSTLLRSKPNFKERARQTMSMRRSRLNIVENGTATFGFDNPVLEIDDDSMEVST